MAWRKGLSYKNEEHETWNSLPVSLSITAATKPSRRRRRCCNTPAATLYLVDNASPDGSGARLEAAVKGGALSTQPGQKVEVRCRKENGGFGTGHNTVLPELTSDYHFILNPDIQLTADTLSDLADWMAGAALPGWPFPEPAAAALCAAAYGLPPAAVFEILGEI